MTICPCCGFKFVGALKNGCRQCGARAVGEPLPKPAHELPSYGRALILVIGGSLTALLFITQTILVMFQRPGLSVVQFWSWIAAGQTAAWRLKWISLPLLITVWLGRKLYRSIKLQPEKFCGLKYARRGLLATSMVIGLIALLIGWTVPERLRQRQMAKEAGIRAQWHTIERAALEYNIRYQTYPADLKDLQKRIPDPDGTLAEAIRNLDPQSYRPSADFAAVATEKSSMRNGPMRKASLSSATDDTPSGGLAFTTYELQLPGEDKILGTDDDWIGSKGILKRASEVAKGGVGRSVSAGVLQP